MKKDIPALPDIPDISELPYIPPLDDAEIRFTMTPSGPRFFEDDDLTPYIELPNVYVVTVFLFLGGYFILLGYYGALGLRFRALPPYSSIGEFLSNNMSFLLSWRNAVYMLVSYFLSLQIYDWSGYVRGILDTRPGRTVTGCAYPFAFPCVDLPWLLPVYAGVIVVTWAFFYFVFLRSRFLWGKAKLFILAPTLLAAWACWPYFIDATYPESFLGYWVGNIGILSSALFWMYIRGMREGELLMHSPGNCIATVMRSGNLPSVRIRIVNHLTGMIIGLDPTNNSIVIIPTRDIQAIIPCEQRHHGEATPNAAENQRS